MRCREAELGQGQQHVLYFRLGLVAWLTGNNGQETVAALHTRAIDSLHFEKCCLYDEIGPDQIDPREKKKPCTRADVTLQKLPSGFTAHSPACGLMILAIALSKGTF